MNVIVFGANHNNTLGLVRSLGEAGYHITLILIGNKKNYVDKSKYIRKCYYLNQDTDIVQLVKEIAANLSCKPVLLSAGDGEASLVDLYVEELSEFVIPEGGRKNDDINKYRDKKTSNALALEIGFDLPKTWIIDHPNTLPDDITFPVFVKANNSIHGGKGVQSVCQNLEELKEKLISIPTEDFPIQTQEYIAKEYEIMLQGCSVDYGEKVVCEVANRKVRFYPHIYSAGSYSYSVQVEGNQELMRLRGLVANYLGHVGYNGLFSAEFLYCNSKFYFLEVNLRNDGTSYLSTACGYNLADIYCKYRNGLSVLHGVYKPYKYLNLKADIHHVINRKVSVCKWIVQFFSAKCYSHFSWHDMKPYFYYFFNL